MTEQTRIVSPSSQERTVRSADGQILQVPKDWKLLLPGDAALTRRVKARGITWTVQEKKGRRIFSKGVWASATRIAEIQEELKKERSTESYAKKRQADVKRRERKQSEYVENFCDAVKKFLNFASCHSQLEERLAQAVTKHATPVGSGTVARTQRIPIEQRAESAVIAWLRHATTAYDDMKIARIKGKRREVRRMLAEKSRQLLADYRSGKEIAPQQCPLQKAMESNNDST